MRFSSTIRLLCTASLASSPWWDNTPITVTDLDAPTSKAGRLSGDVATTAGAFLVTNGQFRDGRNFFMERTARRTDDLRGGACSRLAGDENNRIEVGGFVAAGTLAGTLLGLVCAIVYRRQHGFEHQLLRAIRKDALRIVYQPIVDLGNEQIVEGEALARWTNRRQRFRSAPMTLSRLLKNAALLGRSRGLWCVMCCRISDQIVARAVRIFRVNVNIAAADLADPGFLPMLEKALEEAGFQPGGIGIEITESYTARQQVAKETILRLRQKGHYVHIDDFGTGYSSLAYLHDLSVDAIKIDKAFTKAIGTDAVTVTILPQILTMADTLGLRVIVEGIETPQQAIYFAKAKTGRSMRKAGSLGVLLRQKLFLACSSDKEPEAERGRVPWRAWRIASTIPAA